jgi:hypothetical protein
MLKRGVDFCRGCDSEALFLALGLGESPLANRLLEHPMESVRSFPLELRVCSDCGLGQVGEFETPDEIFSNYPYLSSTSTSWVAANQAFAEELIESAKLQSGDLVIELASNDGYLLKSFQVNGLEVLGVEPAKNIANMAVLAGVPTIPDFFGLELARKMRSDGLMPKVIVAKNVVAHVPDLKDFIAGIAELATSDTLIVVEAPTITQIILGNQFDTIYHEHFSYLSALALRQIFGQFDLELVGAKKLTTHGGSFRFFVQRSNPKSSLPTNYFDELLELIGMEESLGINQAESWRDTQVKVEKCLSDFRNWLTGGGSDLETVAYGAAAKGVTLLAACHANFGAVGSLIDNSPAKAGKFFPIVGSPILTEAEFISQADGITFRYVIFPWNLVEEIVPRIKAFDPEAEVFVAVPVLRRVG